MNPLLTLMHDTGNELCLIGAWCSYLENKSKEYTVESEEIEDVTQKIQAASDRLQSKLDAYYEYIKEQEKMKATKKPVEIDYYPVEENNLPELQKWVESFGDRFEDKFNFIDEGPDGARLTVKTLEGTSYDVLPKDVIIRGVKGEYYPCKKDIFKLTYDTNE